MIDERYVLEPLGRDGGKRGFRREIDEFLDDNWMTNLFLIALRELQQNSLEPIDGGDQPNWLNFYALAGIHGSPREKWCGVKQPNLTYGYCHHGMDTFPTWHRPYMFIYEMAIHREMVKQAEAFENESDRQMYRDAAARFRLPYWDIIMPRNEQKSNGRSDTVFGCPKILKAETVFLKLPEGYRGRTGEFTQLPNPLAYFSFPENFDEFDRINVVEQFKDENGRYLYNPKRTARIPSNESRGVTDNSRVDLCIQRQAIACATMMAQLLNPELKQKAFDRGPEVSALVNESRSWSQFANHGVYRGGEVVTINRRKYGTLSVESFHDGVHAMLGTGYKFSPKKEGGVDFTDGDPKGAYSGQMGDPAFAAFDPMFWLHHNNIERIFCLYQALYPKLYVDNNYQYKEMIPFAKNASGDYFGIADGVVKNYWGSGFAIPGDEQLSEDDVKRKVQEYLTKTYYWASNLQPGDEVDFKKVLPDWPKDLSTSWALNGPDAKPVEHPISHMMALTVQDGQTQLVARSVPIGSSELFQVPDLTTGSPVVSKQIFRQTQSLDLLLPSGALTRVVAENESPIQVTWNAHVKVRKFAFDGTFSIHAFIGWVKDDQPERYMTKKNEAGFTGVFATSNAQIEGCSSCQANRDADMIVEDTIPLTTILYDYLDSSPGSDQLIRDGELKTIPNLEPDNVIPFLKEHLQWRMIDLGANLLADQEQHAGLEITVTSRQYLPPSEQYPMGAYGPYTEHPEITNTKPGGYGYTYPTAT